MRDHSVESDFFWYLSELTDEEREAYFEEIYKRYCKLCLKHLDEVDKCYCDPAYDRDFCDSDE